MNLIDIDYDTLVIIAIALFALGGFFRGWWREGVSTIFLVLLVVFLTQPELAGTIIEAINKLLETIGIIIEARGSLDVQRLSAAASTATPPIELDPSNRSLYILILIVFAVLSYFTGRYTLSDRMMTTGTRIIGGLLGAFNGFIVVNLVKEYIIGRFFPETGLTAQSAAPSTLSVTVSDVPPENTFTGAPLLLIIGIGLIVLMLVLTQRFKKDRNPWGHGVVRVPKPAEKK